MPPYLQHLSPLNVDEMWMASAVKIGQNSAKVAEKGGQNAAAYGKI